TTPPAPTPEHPPFTPTAGLPPPRRGPLPGPHPARQPHPPPPGRPEAAGLARPPHRAGIRRHPDRRGHPGLADVDAAHPVPVQRLVGHLVHAPRLFLARLLAPALVPPPTPRPSPKTQPPRPHPP